MMFKSVLIVSSTVIFTILGMFTGYIAVDRAEGLEWDERMTTLILCPLVGAIIGIGVGCLASMLGGKGEPPRSRSGGERPGMPEGE